jgi:hypothetical protein
MHTHPGEEAYYVIEGATAAMRRTRRSAHWRQKPKRLTVHVVGKGTPMYVPVKP